MSKAFRQWAVIALLCAMTVGGSWAQLYTGSLSGVVTDPTGGVIPNAKVTATDVNKGFTYTGTTDAQGRYNLRALPPSTYRLTVDAPGFNPFEQQNITINVNQSATVDVPMTIAGAQQTVQVIESGAPAIQTEDASTGQTVNRTFINDLPLVGRAVFDLARLAPGVSEPRNNSGWDTNFISQGSRNATADVLLDGVSTVSAEQNGNFQLPLYTPSVDAVQEFRVQQSGFSAEFGFSGSTVLNVVTRSGTNDFHGSLYEFVRNEKFNANSFFANSAGQPKPQMRWNQFGGTAGGRIIRDRLFFFADYQGTRQRSGNTYNAGVPSAPMRAGNFGEICTAGFNGGGMCNDPEQQLWDPYVATWSESAGGPVRSQFIPFNNIGTYVSPGAPQAGITLPQAPGNLINPVGQKYMNAFPMPNYNVGSAAYNRFNNWIGTASDANTGDQIDAKLDFRITDNDMLSGKVAWGRANGTPAVPFGNALDPFSSGPSIGGPRLASLNFTHTFNPTTLLNISLGATRNYQDRPGVGGQFPDYNYITELGLPDYLGASGLPAAPTIYINNYSTSACCGNIGGQGWGIMKYAREVYQLLGTVSKVQGKHEFRIGGETRLHRINFRQAGYPTGLTVFQQNSTSEQPWSGGGDPMAGLLIGYPGYGTWGGVELPLYVSTTAWKYAGFFQDNWHVTDKLTLNLGLRYDLQMPRTERYNRLSYLDPNAPAAISVPGMDLQGAVGFTTADHPHQWDTDWRDFGPRFGFAYQLNPNNVVRGGYGIFYLPSDIGAAGTGPGGNLAFQPDTPWLSTNPAVAHSPYPYATLTNFAPLGLKGYPTPADLNSSFDIGLGPGSPIPAWGKLTPYEQTWNIDIEHQLPAGMVVEATYIGKKGTHLYWGGAGELNYLPEWIGQQYMTGNSTYWNGTTANPFYGIITDPNSGLSAPEIGRTQLLLPYPQYTSFNGGNPPWANSWYNALQLRLEKRMSHGVQFLVTYVFSKSIDDTSSSGGNTDWLGAMSSSVQDPNKRFLERSVSLFDQTHQFQFSWVWQLPFGKGRYFGKGAPRVIDAVLGGWMVNGIFRYTSGFPVALGLNNGQSVPTWGSQRPDLSAPLEKNPNYQQDLAHYFANPDVVSTPAPYALGTAPRALSNIRWPGTNNTSASLFKQFSLANVREGMLFELRLETFNLLNQVQFCGPNSTWNSGSFGQITGQCNTPRQVQLGGKFYF